MLLQVLASPGNSRRPSMPRKPLLCLCRNSIYVNNMQIIHIITHHTAGPRDSEKGFELAKYPCQCRKMPPGPNQEEPNHEPAKGLGPRSLEGLPCKERSILGCHGEDTSKEGGPVVPAAGLSKESKLRLLQEVKSWGSV